MSDTAVAVEAPREACLCGCGDTPKHAKSRFMPGHDAQLKAQLYRIIRDADTPDEAKLEAELTLDKFSWPMPAPKRPRAPKKAAVEDGQANAEVTSADL